MEEYYDKYKALKHEWTNQVASTSKGVIQNVINKMILLQHIESFEPDEWGELTDYAGLQEKLYEIRCHEIEVLVGTLEDQVNEFTKIYDQIKAHMITIKDIKLPLSKNTDPSTFIDPVLKAYETELSLRLKLANDLITGIHLHSPYDILVTILAAWSGQPYTNDRILAPYEKYMEVEQGITKISKLSVK